MSTLGTLTCLSGHLVKKYKRLKPWQGRLQIMRCGICTINLDRETFRWRCEEHCDYNVCEDCFNDHWLRVLDQAATTENTKRRFQLLSSVPEHLHATAEYQAAERYSPPGLPGPAEPAGLGASTESSVNAAKTKKVKGGLKPPRVAESTGACPAWCANMQVVFWVMLWVVGMVLSSFFIQRLLLDKALAFPSTLLMMALSNFVSYLLLQLTVICSRCFISLGTDPDWKGSAVFGGMMCVQGALSSSAMCRSEMYHNIFVTAFAVTLFGAGCINHSEQFQVIPFLSATLAMVGGLVAMSAKGAFAPPGFDVLGYDFWSLVIGTMRLIMTQNFLGMEDPNHRKQKLSPLVLAVRMAPAVGIASFELACITAPGSFELLPQLPHRVEIAGLLCIIGVFNAATLVAELQLLQLTSATLLGLLMPCTSICAVLLPNLLQRSRPPLMILVGGGVYALAISLYICARLCGAPDGDADTTDYQPLEGGERERRRHRRGSRDGHRVRIRDGSDSDRSPRNSARGGRDGRGVFQDDDDWL